MLEKYYQLSAKNVLKNETEIKLIKVVGVKKDIDKYIRVFINEMFNAFGNINCKEITREEYKKEKEKNDYIVEVPFSLQLVY